MRRSSIPDRHLLHRASGIYYSWNLRCAGKHKSSSVRRQVRHPALWTVAHQAPLFMGFSRQEDCTGLPWPPPRDLPNPGIKPRSLTSQAGSLASVPWGKAKNTGVGNLFLLQGRSPGSSQPRNWTRVSCIAGWFFTSWATRETPTCQQLYIMEATFYHFLPLLQAEETLNVLYSAAGTKSLVKIMLFWRQAGMTSTVSTNLHCEGSWSFVSKEADPLCVSTWPGGCHKDPLSPADPWEYLYHMLLPRVPYTALPSIKWAPSGHSARVFPKYSRN